MKKRTLKIIAFVVLANIFLLVSLTALILNCPIPNMLREMELIIDNQSDQNLTIYLDGVELGNVSSGETIASEALFDDRGRYTITALNNEGEIVFAKRFTHETLIHLNNWDRKAVIPWYIPRRGATSIDLVIENKSDMVLTILVEGNLVGDASPGESVTESNLPIPYITKSREFHYHVVAKNAEGQKVFGENLELSKLQIMHFKTLIAVIEPFYKEITFHNKARTVVTVFVNYYRVGEIGPGETVKKNVPLYSDLVGIIAKDNQGKTVYYIYRNYVSWEFRDKKWEEVITPFGE